MRTISLSQFGLGTNLVIFCLAAAVVWFAGTRLTHYVDAIGTKKRLNKAFLGFLVLATMTQLPEVVTNSTAALIGDARLLLNSMFGGVSMQTAVLVIADGIAGGYALTRLSRSPSTLAQAAMLVGLLALILGVSVSGDIALPGQIGLIPLLLAGLYLGSIGVLWRMQGASSWQPADAETGERFRSGLVERNTEDKKKVTGLVLRSLLAGVAILVAGVLLVLSAEAVAARSGLGSSFVGVTLLATATSLPELSTTIAAVRLGQPGMAISDIFGSNMIMVALLLPSDILYREGILIDGADDSARFALALAMMLTSIYLVGLVVRRAGSVARLGLDSWSVLGVYAVGVAVLYGLR